MVRPELFESVVAVGLLAPVETVTVTGLAAALAVALAEDELVVVALVGEVEDAAKDEDVALGWSKPNVAFAATEERTRNVGLFAPNPADVLGRRSKKQEEASGHINCTSCDALNG